MELTKARLLAQSHLVKTGLAAQGWRFEFDGAVKRFGQCNYRLKRITLSKHLVSLNPVEVVEQTILHEVAHALVGPGHGHGLVWKRKALALGHKTANRTYSADVTQPSLRYKGTCPGGHEHSRQKRPTRALACGRCSRRFDSRYVITWTDTRTRSIVTI